MRKASAVCKNHQAKSPGIGKPDDGPVADLEHDVLMKPVSLAGGRWFNAGSLDDDATRHAKMCQQDSVVIALPQEILASATECGHLAPDQPVGKVFGYGKSQIPAAHLYMIDASSNPGFIQPTPNGFDFGKFRHPDMVAGPTMERYVSCMSTTDNIDHTRLVRDVFNSVASRYDIMNDLMSGGLHRLWKTVFVARTRPRSGDLLVDVAGGTGDIASDYLRRGGGEAIICDINEQMLQAGRDRRLDRGRVDGPPMVCGDAAAIPLEDGCADVCTIAFGLRNVTRRQEALTEMRRILALGGHFLCLEFSPAVLPAIRPLYDAYSFTVLPWLGSVVARDRDAYLYLVDSIRRFPGPEKLAEEIRSAGFDNVKQTSLTGGIVWIHSAWRT